MATSEWVPVVDISQWQGDYNFDKARDQGVEGFILRVSHGNVLDTKVGEYYQKALLAGYEHEEVGFYQFLNPKRGTAEETARFSAHHIQQVTGRTDVLYMMDIENYVHHTPNKGQGALSPADFATYIRKHWNEFAKLMPGSRVIGYANRAFWNGPIGPQDATLASQLDWMVPRYPVHGHAAYEAEGYPTGPASQWDEWALSFTNEYPQEPAGAKTWAGWQFSADYNKQGQRYGASSADLDLNIVRREYWEAWKVSNGAEVEVRYPYGYGTGTYTMKELRARYEPKMHPEFARRLFNWLEAQGGKFGIGGGWRKSNPPLPGFAPDGKSFHQYQAFPSGTSYAAVDLVVKVANGKHRAPRWHEAPAQGSASAKKWGVHINVGTEPRGEPWHMQPVEIDGWQSWMNAGQPDLDPNYPIPVKVPPEQIIPDLPIPELPPILGEAMNSLVVHDGVRLYDSRRSGDKKPDKGTVKIQVANKTPEGADVVLALTTVSATEHGFVTVWSGDGDVPNISNVNYGPADPSPKNGFAVSPVSDDGTFSIFVKGTTHVIVDQLAYIEEVDPAVDVDVEIDVDMIVEAAVDAVVARLENG